MKKQLYISTKANKTGENKKLVKVIKIIEVAGNQCFFYKGDYYALRIAKKIGLGARKYHNKKFGGGIAFNVPFDSSGLEKLSNKINAFLN